MDAPPGAARASLAPLDAADPEPDPARSSKRSNRAGRKKRGPKTHSKTGRLNSLDAGPRASASSDDADFPTSRQPLNKHAVLGGLSGRPAQPEGVAAYADQAAAADPGLGSLSDSPGAAVSPPAYSHSPHPGGGGDPPSRADERVASKRSGRSRASGRSAGSGAGGAGEALSSISTMVAISNGVDGDGQSQQFVPDEFLARSDTLLNMSDQVRCGAAALSLPSPPPQSALCGVTAVAPDARVLLS